MTDLKRDLEQPNGLKKPDAKWMAFRITTLLSHYYQPDQPSPLSEAVMMDWLRLLDGYSKAAIEHACDGYLRDQPRRRPTPGDILARAKAKDEGDAARRRMAERPPLVLEAPEGPRETVTAEQAERIKLEAGYTRELSETLRRFPRALTREHAVEAEKNGLHASRGFSAPTESQLRAARMSSPISRAAMGVDDG